MLWTTWLALAQAAAGPSTVTLSDGQELVAAAVENPDGTWTLTLEDGRAFTVPGEVVRAVAVEDDATAAVDPLRSRYFYSPTAFGLGHGQGYVAQREIALTSAAVGITDYVDVEAGVILPILFTEGRVAVGGLKFGVPVAGPVHAGGGAQAVLVPEVGVIGFAFANLTVGVEDQHATIATGPALSFSSGELGAWATTLSLTRRVRPSLALLTENWVLWIPKEAPWGVPFFVVPSGGARLFGPSFAVDLALVPIVTGEREVPVMPLPWVSFAWFWGAGG